MTESVAAKHILVVPHKEKAIELLDGFAGNFDWDLLEIRAEQGLVFVSDVHRSIDLWLLSATMAKNTKMAADKRELDDLVSALGENMQTMYGRHPHLTRDRAQNQKRRWPQCDLDKGISWCWEICLGS